MTEPTYAITALYGDEMVFLKPIRVGQQVLNEFQAVPFLSKFGPVLKASFEAAENDERLTHVRIIHMPVFGHTSGSDEP